MCWRQHIRYCGGGLLATALLMLPVCAQQNLPASFTPRAAAPATPDPWEPRPVEPSKSLERPLPTRTSPAQPRTGTATSRPSSLPLWGTVTALICLAGGLVVALKWIRRHGPAVLRALPNEAVEPLGQRVLSRGVAVHLVRCGSRMLLLGVGPDGVRTLVEITDPVEVDVIAGACRRRDESTAGMAAFAQLLQRSATPRGVSDDVRSQRVRYPAGMTEVDGV